jgi:hypothetical protein
MVKFCMSCGKENEDGAVFCIGCGQRFPPEAANSVQPGGVTQQAPPFPVFAAEIGPGAHQHILTDVYLKDSAGKVLLVARKPSLIHSDYTIVDGTEGVQGFMKGQTHLTHKTTLVEDASHNPLGAVQASNISQNRAPPSCWVEDAAGNRLATIAYFGLMSFGAIKPDGSTIFEARLSAGTGILHSMNELEHRAYAISLADPGFPLPMLLAVITVVEHA